MYLKFSMDLMIVITKNGLRRLKDENGSIFFINLQQAVLDEIKLFGIQHFVNLGKFSKSKLEKMNPMTNGICSIKNLK